LTSRLISVEILEAGPRPRALLRIGRDAEAQEIYFRGRWRLCATNQTIESDLILEAVRRAYSSGRSSTEEAGMTETRYRKATEQDQATAERAFAIAQTGAKPRKTRPEASCAAAVGRALEEAGPKTRTAIEEIPVPRLVAFATDAKIPKAGSGSEEGDLLREIAGRVGDRLPAATVVAILAARRSPEGAIPKAAKIEEAPKPAAPETPKAKPKPAAKKPRARVRKVGKATPKAKKPAAKARQEKKPAAAK
jgi:hypothetical protein